MAHRRGCLLPQQLIVELPEGRVSSYRDLNKAAVLQGGPWSATTAQASICNISFNLNTPVRAHAYDQSTIRVSKNVWVCQV